jgi:hypothetical protein
MPFLPINPFLIYHFIIFLPQIQASDAAFSAKNCVVCCVYSVVVVQYAKDTAAKLPGACQRWALPIHHAAFRGAQVRNGLRL